MVEKNIALSAHQISVKGGNRPILKSLDLALPQARWTAIVGPNGAGKSTLLKVLAGLWPGQSMESVHLLGQPLSAWAPKARAQTLAWMGQNEVASQDLTSYDIAMLGRLPHRAWLAAR